MVALDKTTKTPPASSSSTTTTTATSSTSQTTTHNNNNLQKNGIKKATYSVISENQNENVEVRIFLNIYFFNLKFVSKINFLYFDSN